MGGLVQWREQVQLGRGLVQWGDWCNGAGGTGAMGDPAAVEGGRCNGRGAWCNGGALVQQGGWWNGGAHAIRVPGAMGVRCNGVPPAEQPGPAAAVVGTCRYNGGGGQGMCTPKGLRKLSWGAARNCAAAPLQKEQGTTRIPWGAGGADAPRLTAWHGGDALPQFPSPAAPICPQFPPLLTLLSRCCSRHLKHRGRSLGSSSRVQGRSRVCLSHSAPPITSLPLPADIPIPVHTDSVESTSQMVLPIKLNQPRSQCQDTAKRVRNLLGFAFFFEQRFSRPGLPPVGTCPLSSLSLPARLLSDKNSL